MRYGPAWRCATSSRWPAPPLTPTSRCESLQTKGAFGSSLVVGNVTKDHRTLLALKLNGETLAVDHGYPCRLIAPNRPGVFQTKWVNKLVVKA